MIHLRNILNFWIIKSVGLRHDRSYSFTNVIGYSSCWAYFREQDKLFLSWELMLMNHTTRFSNSLVWERHTEKFALYIFISVTLKKIVLLQFRWLISTRILNKYLVMGNVNRDKQTIQIQGFLGGRDKLVE